MKKVLLLLVTILTYQFVHAQVCFRNAGRYTAGINLGSMACGDFNHDHIMDLAVADPNFGSVYIYFSTAPGTLTQQVTLVNSLNNLFSVVSADFNSDSLDDIAFSAFNDSVYIYLSNGNGTFNRLTTYVRNGAFFLTTGDFNSDHITDLVAQGLPTNDSLSFLQCDGSGGFLPAVTSFSGGGGGRIKTLQANADTFPDIAFTNANGMSVMFGNGTGRFSGATNLISSFGITEDFVCGDFTGDGIDDIVELHYSYGNLEMYHNNGTGNFTAQQVYDLQAYPQYLTINDFDQDGNPDVFCGDGSLFFGDGAGGLGQLNLVPLSNGAFNLTTGDFDNDTYPDLVLEESNATSFDLYLNSRGITSASVAVTNPICPGEPATANAIVTGNGAPYTYEWSTNDTTQTAHNYYSIGGYVTITANDGCQAYITFTNTLVSIYSVYATLQGSGCGSNLSDVTLHVSGGTPPYTYQWSTGATDSIANGLSGGAYVVNLVDSAACTFSDTLDVPLALNYSFNSSIPLNAFQPVQMIAADFNNDNLIDIATTNLNSISVLINQGGTTFASAVTYNFPGSSTVNAMHYADINNDGFVDILIAKSTSIYSFISNGNGTFAAVSQLLQGTSIIRNFATGYFNNDNNIDLVYFYNTGSVVKIYLGNGNGTFTAGASISGYPENVTTGDMNNDGNTDLISSESGSYLIATGNGNGTFSQFNYRGTGFGDTFLTTGDYNFDGNLDLTSTGGTAYIKRLKGTGTGNLTSGIVYNIRRSITMADMGDLNADGAAFDLVCVDGPGGLVSILQSDTSGRYSLPTQIEIGCTVSAVALADFDNDQKTDIALALLDSNSVLILTNCTITGITEAKSPDSFNLYPNPAHDFIYPDRAFSAEARIDIFNSNGQCVMNIKGNVKGIDVHSLPQGVYHVRISDRNTVSNSRFVVVK